MTDPPFLDGLNSKQCEAATYGGRSLLILAGAGSGKTRVITTRIAWLIARGTAISEILAVTFTNKAAREMHDRVLHLAPDSGGVVIRTFHSFCARFLRRNAEAAGLDPRFVIYDDDDSVSLLHAAFESVPRRELRNTAHQISRAKDYLLGPESDLSSITLDPEFETRYREYQRRLDAMGNCDFGDLILKSVRLLANDRSVRESVQNQFRHVLVDEYQDSYVAQFELLKRLVGANT